MVVMLNISKWFIIVPSAFHADPAMREKHLQQH